MSVLQAQVKSERLEPGLAGVMELADSVALKVCTIPCEPVSEHEHFAFSRTVYVISVQ